MKEVFELVRTSMKDGGVPTSLITAAEQSWPDTDMQTKITAASAALEFKPLLLVTGPESPKKDLVCAKLMRKFMMDKNKNGLWLTPPRIPTSSYKEDSIPTRGVTVVVGMDILVPFQISVVSQLLRDRLARGAVFIVPVTSDGIFMGVLVPEFRAYCSHLMAVVEIPSKPAELMRM